MKTKYLVCETSDNKLLGGTSYSTEDEAIDAFCAVVSEYGIEAYEEMINSKIFRDEGGCTVQIVEIIDK